MKISRSIRGAGPTFATFSSSSRIFPRPRLSAWKQNYRSTQNILQAASSVVANNVRRKGKNLWTSRQGGTKIGYYEAPDGENEALFAADHIAKYLREAAQHGEAPRAAVLYRTNSQSRLFEEAMRRYGLKYKVVGGFSFYERAEIKDMISYLKVIQNPDDSISLLRVINTPTRGIGKGTIDTLEHLALETGLSLWGAVGEAIRRQLLPQRALAALKNFRQLIVDAQAMLAGTFCREAGRECRRRECGAGALARRVRDSGTDFASRRRTFNADDAAAFDPTEFENSAFDFGGSLCGKSRLPLRKWRRGAFRRQPARSRSYGGLRAATPCRAGLLSRIPAPTRHTADLLKFLIDRTGYIKLLEDEDTPEAFSRIENLRELVNAAMDSRDRGETLDQFLDHAALISDADDYDERAQITLMSLHAAKGLEFPLVFLSGLEEGLFPHSRTMLQPDDVEEERRLCYVGMTRAMDQLILTRAVYRRRYGTDLPEASVPSRFLEEVPAPLIEELGRRGAQLGVADAGNWPRPGALRRGACEATIRLAHYSYEDEDQSASWKARQTASGPARQKPTAPAKPYNSIENIAEFFASGARSLACRKRRSKSRRASADSVPGRRFGIPNMARGRSTSEKEKAKKPRLRYNFLASD